MNIALWAAIGVGVGGLAGQYLGNVPIGIAAGMAACVLAGGIVDALRRRSKGP